MINEYLESSGDEKTCGEKYSCPDGVHTCETRWVEITLVCFYEPSSVATSVSFRTFIAGTLDPLTFGLYPVRKSADQ